MEEGKPTAKSPSVFQHPTSLINPAIHDSHRLHNTLNPFSRNLSIHGPLHHHSNLSSVYFDRLSRCHQDAVFASSPFFASSPRFKSPFIESLDGFPSPEILSSGRSSSSPLSPVKGSVKMMSPMMTPKMTVKHLSSSSSSLPSSSGSASSSSLSSPPGSGGRQYGFYQHHPPHLHPLSHHHHSLHPLSSHLHASSSPSSSSISHDTNPSAVLRNLSPSKMTAMIPSSSSPPLSCSPSIKTMKDIQFSSSSSSIAAQGMGNNRCKTKICGVCGDRAKSYHFGGISCDSCKAFFRRSVQNDAYKNFHCPYEGQCDINITSRKCCQFCRFKKCLSIGMEKSWVMTEEERLQMLKTRLEKKQKQSDQLSSSESSNSRVSCPPANNSINESCQLNQEKLVTNVCKTSLASSSSFGLSTTIDSSSSSISSSSASSPSVSASHVASHDSLQVIPSDNHNHDRKLNASQTYSRRCLQRLRREYRPKLADIPLYLSEQDVQTIEGIINQYIRSCQGFLMNNYFASREGDEETDSYSSSEEEEEEETPEYDNKVTDGSTHIFMNTSPSALNSGQTRKRRRSRQKGLVSEAVNALSPSSFCSSSSGSSSLPDDVDADSMSEEKEKITDDPHSCQNANDEKKQSFGSNTNSALMTVDVEDEEEEKTDYDTSEEEDSDHSLLDHHKSEQETDGRNFDTKGSGKINSQFKNNGRRKLKKHEENHLEILEIKSNCIPSQPHDQSLPGEQITPSKELVIKKKKLNHNDDDSDAGTSQVRNQLPSSDLNSKDKKKIKRLEKTLCTLFTSIQQFSNFCLNLAMFQELTSQDQESLLKTGILEMVILSAGFFYDVRSQGWPMMSQETSAGRFWSRVNESLKKNCVIPSSLDVSSPPDSPAVSTCDTKRGQNNAEPIQLAETSTSVQSKRSADDEVQGGDYHDRKRLKFTSVETERKGLANTSPRFLSITRLEVLLTDKELFEKHQKLLTMIASLDLDEVSILLVSLVILFNPDRVLDSVSFNVVGQRQEYFLSLLQSFLTWRFSPEVSSLLFRKILLMLPDLKELSDSMNEYSLLFCHEEVRKLHAKVILQENMCNSRDHRTDKDIEEMSRVKSSFSWSLRNDLLPSSLMDPSTLSSPSSTSTSASFQCPLPSSGVRGEDEGSQSSSSESLTSSSCQDNHRTKSNGDTSSDEVRVSDK